MNYRKIIKSAVQAQQDNNSLTAFALVAGLAAGAALAVLFAPRSGRDLRKILAEKLSDSGELSGDKSQTDSELKNQLVEDLRENTRTHADQLQGPKKKRKDPTEIKVPSAGTLAWKKKTIES